MHTGSGPCSTGTQAVSYTRMLSQHRVPGRLRVEPVSSAVRRDLGIGHEPAVMIVSRDTAVVITQSGHVFTS